MATPVGANIITSLSRRHILPVVTDNVYLGNPLIFRLLALNKKILQGGFQIEVPLMFKSMAAGGPYQGFDVLDTTPSDTVINAAFDWKQYDVPVSIDGLSLARMDAPDAIVNGLSLLFTQAQMQMLEFLGVGVWSDAKTNVKAIDGVAGAVDDGTNTGTYGGLSRTTFPFWKSQTIPAATASFAATGLNDMMTQFGNCTAGGRHPTIIFMTQSIYNAMWKASTPGQSFPVQPEGHDAQLAQNGFTNMLFNGVPALVDSHVPVPSGLGQIFFLNEDYFFLYVNSKADLAMREFREPINQDAMVAFLLWYGNLCCSNPNRNAKMTVTAA